MPITLTLPAAGSTTYVADNNGNFTIIEDAINTLQTQVLTLGGENADLINDLYDRAGIIGDHSYQLDVAAYAGGASITVGRRPAPTSPPEENESIALVSVNGVLTRVVRSGDIALSAAAIIAGLPKTIYVGVPANGVPQFYEDTTDLSVLYVWSMTWDGADLTAFRRICPILPHYTLVQSIADRVQKISAEDHESNYLAASGGTIAIALPGTENAGGNGIGIRDGLEVVGFYATIGSKQEDGLWTDTPVSGAGSGTQLRLDVRSAGVTWSDDPLTFDATAAFPQTVYAAVDVGVVASSRFVFTKRHFTLRAEHVGGELSAASPNLTFGILARPVHGRVDIAKGTFPLGSI
ncbi:MAG TPA: hypothetical protein VJB14_17635 [Planctomycetota bacterium]|nr:hypothetical protein [Planctomycetota bacterium]